MCVHVLASRIARDPRLEVVGHAYDGLRAVELAAKLRPAVITMDLHMPRLDGLAAIARIMRECPTRILVVTSADARSTEAFEALKAGALDLMEKPRADDPHDALCDRIWALAREPMRRRSATPSAPPPRRAGVGPILAVGIVASTGGPAALGTILGALPADLSATIFVVQHLPPRFAPRLASWLDATSSLSVAIAQDGEFPRPGRVLVAGDDRHLTVDAMRRVRLSADPPDGGHRPSGTRLLMSLASAYGPRAAGIVLTGMGKDGVAGLRALRNAGGRTAAQDEESSAVYGMPRAAMESGAAEVSISLADVAPYIVQLAGRSSVR